MYNNLAVSRPGVCDKVRRAGDYRPTRATVCNSDTLCGIVKEARLDSETRVVPVCFFFVSFSKTCMPTQVHCLQRAAGCATVTVALSCNCNIWVTQFMARDSTASLRLDWFEIVSGIGLCLGIAAIIRRCVRPQILLALSNLSLMSERLKAGRRMSSSFRAWFIERHPCCAAGTRFSLLSDGWMSLGFLVMLRWWGLATPHCVLKLSIY